MNLQNTYKGYTISYDGKTFEILLEDKIQTRRPKDLEACIAWVDRQLKEEFVRTKVLVASYRDDSKEAEATSLVENRVWVVYSDGKREMVDATDLRVFSEDNLVKEARFRELSKQAETLIKEARAVKESLEVFDVSSMIVSK
jgi:hypothetical protein